MNPNGSHPVFPVLPNGRRDVDYAWDLRDTWKQMEAVLKKAAYFWACPCCNLQRLYVFLPVLITGKVKAIGVSNFSKLMLEKILPGSEIIPAVDQVRDAFRDDLDPSG
jgi:glycerol 2-dehydrogenase (NADP+)